MQKPLTLAYETHGAVTAVPVTLLHGYPLNRLLWTKQEALKQTCRLVLPDLPGFGASPLPSVGEAGTVEAMADQVAALLDALGIPRTVLMGHSMGGYVALAFAERHPDRLSALGLVCSRAGADTDEARQRRLAGIDQVRRTGSRDIVDAMRDVLFSEKTLHTRPELVRDVHELMHRAHPEAVINALRVMAARPDRRALLPEIDVPALVVAGADDRIVPVEESEAMARSLPQGRLAVIPDAGHLVMVEQAEAFNRQVTGFLQETGHAPA